MEKQAMRFLNLLANHFFMARFTYLLNQRRTDTLFGAKALCRRDYGEIEKKYSRRPQESFPASTIVRRRSRPAYYFATTLWSSMADRPSTLMDQATVSQRASMAKLSRGRPNGSPLMLNAQRHVLTTIQAV